MITLEDYWMGRDVLYPDECTEDVKRSATETVKRVNKFLAEAEKDGIIRDKVSSGFRPRKINDETSNAAKKSNHLLAKAVDIADPERKLAQWMIKNKMILSMYSLWAEDPRWCGKRQKDGTWAYWVHIQIVPPASAKLIFIPSLKPPVLPKLEGQHELPLMRIV